MNDSTGNAARLEEERFHDLIHSVNSDGLQSMAWPGRRKKEPEQSENGGTDGTGKNRNTSEIDRKSGEKAQKESSKDKAKTGNKVTQSIGSANKEESVKSSQRSTVQQKENTAVSPISIEGEWGDFKVRLSGYNSRDSNTMRYVILLPERIHDIMQVVFNRDSSAAISVILQSFIDRNRGNMRDLITERSTLF